ncbi:MAG: tetratricopeptide repeat protein [Bacteroidia bacterium]|nr:tetratricopeptide repeat protein [Bacteroidia bacterium]
MKLIYIFLFCLSSVLISSQNKELDSLKQCLKVAKADSTKLRLYSRLSEICEEKDIPLYTTPAISLAESIFKTTKSNSLNTNSSDINLSDLPPKAKKSILNSYGRALNSQGIYEISQGNNPQGIAIFEKALKVQSENNDTLLMAATLGNIGANLYFIGQIQRSMDAYQQSLTFFNDINDKKGIAQTYNGISMVYRSQGNVLKGIDYMFKSLKISEELKDKEAIANQYNNLCVYYLDVEDFQKAKEFGEKSLEIAQKNNFKSVQSNAYNNLAYVYKKNGDTTRLLQYLNLSLNLSLEAGNKNELVTAYNNMGVVYKDKKNYKEAINYFEKALGIANTIGAKDGQANSYTKLGSVYLALNDKTKALQNALKAYHLSNELGTPVDIRNAAELLKDIYTGTGQYQKALEMTHIYYATRDSILNNNYKQEAIKKQYKYEFDKKLIADSIKNVEEKNISTTKIALQNSELKQQQLFRYALIIGLVLITAFLIFFYNRFRITQKQKNIIQTQNEVTEKQRNELELKNKNITESILVAKEIQYIIFPSEAELAKTFPQHFMFFKPCDILSGDFLWLKTIEQRTFVILGDCTGHGVPASLLTMFANEFLNKIIVQQKITKASEILQLVNEEIYNYIQRKQKNIKTLDEGMDIGICVIDKQKNELTFCGAKIDLLYTSKHAGLNIANGNKLVLGKELHPEKIYLEHILPIGGIDTIYMTTDGLNDQFKYKTNKTKFGFKGFENFIKQNNSKPLEEQKQSLQSVFDDIVAQQVQIDDILAFACKISN